MCDHRTLTCAYLLLLHTVHGGVASPDLSVHARTLYVHARTPCTVVSPPHKSLCGAQACNFATCASCSRVMRSARLELLYNRRPFLAAKPAHIVTDLINWVGFMTPFAGVTQFLIWSQKTVKIDQMSCQCKPKSFGAKTGMFVSSIAGILLMKTLIK